MNITCGEVVNADPTYRGRLSSKPQFPARGVDLGLIYLYNYGASEPYVYSTEEYQCNDGRHYYILRRL